MNTYLKYSLGGLFSLLAIGLIYIFSTRVNGRYVLLSKQELGCINLAQLEVYSTPFGQNIAKNAKVIMSSLYGDDFKGENLTNGLNNSIAHTVCGGPENQNILVDLGQEFPIYKINLFNRSDCCSSRSNGIILTILNGQNQLVYSANELLDKNGNNRDDNQNNAYGQYVFFPPVKRWFGF